MVLDNPDLADLAKLAVRTLEHQVRQAVSSTVSSAVSSATTSPDPTSASSTPASFTSPQSDPTSSAGNSGSTGGGSSGGGGSQGSSPLLFFVALGFGVVFTNLWIIVGVKYCFRYNARNRNIRATGEDGEPINLEHMPQHPRRRRREKKLMTIDEVNEKFPMMKYKSWVATRAQEGLPTRGGISRPNSIRDADGIIPISKEQDSIEERPETSAASIAKQTTREPTAEHAEEKSEPALNENGEARSMDAPAASTAEPPRTDSPGSDDERDEDDDQIHDALPHEMLESSGDTCAICIDTLEDDDDVRGLTCGHAFHAVCLDPWLTSRRACCPLCKADYYTPKPRPPPPEGAEGTQVGPTVSIAQDPRTNRMNMPNRPGMAWIFQARNGRLGLTPFNRNQNDGSTRSPRSPRNRGNGGGQQQQYRGGLFGRSATQSSSRPSPPANSPTEEAQNQSGGILSSLRAQVTRFGRPRATQNQHDLEAGTAAR